MYYTYLTNQQAQDYLALKLALEELKLEAKENRKKNGTPVGQVTLDEVDYKIVILYLDYIVEDLMWDWLETCP